MSPDELETRWLSLRFWLLRCVLPSALSLTGLLLLVPIFIDHPGYRDQTSVIFGFFTLYFVLFRGGHLFMIRSMHFDLKKTYGKSYEAKLQALPSDLRRQNLGFRLARIKRELIDTT